ncbi:MAG TPA: WecB/TagA/CpsF family glycosyltransferase [Opitutaceae bacterium]|nr:WecB/TagA/CpsF family glycosyltransferase [Opitutaceae bacterium]
MTQLTKKPPVAARPQPDEIPRFNVLGVGVSALTLDRARDLLLSVRGGARSGYVCFGTAHGLSEARSDPAFREILNHAWFTAPDGMPLVWLAHRHGHRQVTRVYGPDLMLAVCDAGRTVGLTHYFFGGAPGVAEALRDKLMVRFPGLQIAGIFTPPFRPLTDGEWTALRSDLAEKKPDIVWVGLGTPKQERFMAAHWRELDAGALVGVGAAFDFFSGRVRQAPQWIRRRGLEWLFRLGMEPRRLGPRYLKTNPLFALRVLAQLAGWKKYPLG